MEILNLVITSALTILVIFLTYQASKTSKIEGLEAKNRVLELQKIDTSIKRVHHRLDEVETSNEKVLESLTDPKSGVFVRLTKIETQFNMEE